MSDVVSFCKLATISDEPDEPTFSARIRISKLHPRPNNSRHLRPRYRNRLLPKLARPDRDVSVWLFCHDYGWILGLIAIGFSMVGMFRSKKERILSALTALVTLGSFARHMEVTFNFPAWPRHAGGNIHGTKSLFPPKSLSLAHRRLCGKCNTTTSPTTNLPMRHPPNLWQAHSRSRAVR